MTIKPNVKSAAVAALAVGVLLAGCGKSLTGTYTDQQSGNISLSFQSGGKVRYHASQTGFTQMDSYTISGKKLTVKSDKGTVGTFNIQPDGCLRSPTMGLLCKPEPPA